MPSPSALVLIADGSEEIEAVTTIDILRRAAFDVRVIAVAPQPQIIASRSVLLVADGILAELKQQDWDVIVLPGGMPGAENLAANAQVIQLISRQMQSENLLAAICAAPAVVLGRQGLLSDRVATCFPAFMDELNRQALLVSHDDVVVDDNLVTSRGPATAMKFALTLVALIAGQVKANQVAQGLLMAEPFSSSDLMI